MRLEGVDYSIHAEGFEVCMCRHFYKFHLNGVACVIADCDCMQFELNQKLMTPIARKAGKAKKGVEEKKYD